MKLSVCRGGYMFSSMNVWTRWRARAACLSMAALVSHVCAEEKLSIGQPLQSQANWVIVQPAFAQGFRFDTAQALAHELSRMLGRQIVVDAATRGQGDAAFRWSLSVAAQQYAVLVAPEESLRVSTSSLAHPAHIANFEPLLLLGFKRWCAFVHSESPLQAAGQLHSWVAQLDRPVRIALPFSEGRMQLWVHGMEHATNHAWQVQPYSVNGDFAAVLEQGADLALARCDRIGASSTQVRALVQSGRKPFAGQPETPTFEEAGWLPFEHGWTALFVPKAVPEQERSVMEQALQRIASTSKMRDGLKLAGFEPADLSPGASRIYLERFVSGWAMVEQFLLDEHVVDAWRRKASVKH